MLTVQTTAPSSRSRQEGSLLINSRWVFLFFSHNFFPPLYAPARMIPWGVFFSCARLFFESYDTIQDTLQVKGSHDSFAALATLSVSSARGAFYTLWPALSLAWRGTPAPDLSL